MRAAQTAVAGIGADAADGIIYILLPVHNRRALTERFVRCVLEQTDQDYHLVLIDDGSSDGTEDIVRELLPGVTVLRGSGNWWWAGSLQQGYKWLKNQRHDGNEIVLIANDDTSFEKDFFSKARAALQRRPGSMLLAQLYSEDSGELLDVGVNVEWRTMQFRGVKDAALVNCFSTRGLFLKLVDFLTLGGFYPGALPHYGSDYEFTIRAARRGLVLASDPAVRLWFNEKTTGTHRVVPTSVTDFFRQTFSKKTVTNPVYFSIFLLLACPRRYVLLNLLRVWRGFAGALLRALLRR